MSVAGKQAGIHEGARSNLFFEAIRIIEEMRNATNGEYPKYAVWENVCFHKDTLVTCENGYKPISEVSIGEKVKTLSGRYMPVARVHKTSSQKVIRLSVSGSEDLIVTPNHPFWVKEKIISKVGGKRVRSFTAPEWKPASELTEYSLVAYKLDTPSLPYEFITEAEAWAVGRYLADGSADLSKVNPRIFISVGKGKEEEARKRLGELPFTIHENMPHDTATNFCFTSLSFWKLVESAGVGAGNKQVPPFVFSLPIQRQAAVLDGYLSGDGYVRNRSSNQTELSAETASRHLAYGIARLIRNVYHKGASITVHPPKDGKINGRTLHANYPSYQIYASLSDGVSQSIYDDENEIMWQPVKSVVPMKDMETVYNLSVLEDNTYGANDIFVHNCGAFSSGKGSDFRAVVQAFADICQPGVDVPMPPAKTGWKHAGLVMGDNQGWSFAYRLVDAQWWGVPQRRKRIYAVCSFRAGDAGDILFDVMRDGVTRNFSEAPDPVVETRLSQILQYDAPARYDLSARACQGIINRANKRGKQLPTMLKDALEEVIANDPDKGDPE